MIDSNRWTGLHDLGNSSHGRVADAREPIAIIGIGCRFPGGVTTPEAFWQLLAEGRDAISEVPADRWALKDFYDPDTARAGKMYTRYGGFVDNVDRFDAAFFGISPREAEVMDPQQRWLLEVAWEAFEDANEPAEGWSGSSAGVFVGFSSQDFSTLQGAPSERRVRSPYKLLGTVTCVAANRLSYLFNLHGPSLTVDTACSSSLTALHLACQSIWSGESPTALMGGVSLLLRPEPYIGFCNASMLSPDGRCKAFAARANGYVRAEGAAVVLLKRLSLALKDGNSIYATILGTAANQDGHNASLTIPNGEAQQRMLRSALQQAGMKPADVQYIEAHGTGTTVGDPIEANSVGSVLSEGRSADSCCWIGSVKTNIGHLEAGSGMAGLIKTALALKHRQIPPHLHFQAPNPAINFQQLKLRVPTQLEPWPENGLLPRLAGVNSFGFGGANAHAVLAEAPRAPLVEEESAGDRAQLIPLSARSTAALHDLASAWKERLAHDEAWKDAYLRDLACNASLCRGHLPHRLTLVAANKADLAAKLDAFVNGDTLPAGVAQGATRGNRPPLVFVYTGMGPQWWGMGRELLQDEPVFRRAVEQCEARWRVHAGWSLLDEMLSSEDTSHMDEARVAQPAIFALQVGLTALWRAWGIEPDAIVGHSVGEIAAAYAAHALSLEDAIRVVFHRSRLQQRLRGQGRMLAVGLPAEQVAELLRLHAGRIDVAAINSPKSVTLSGSAEILEQIHSALKEQDVFASFLRTDVPYHSGHMEVFRDEFLGSLERLGSRHPERPLYSTVTGVAVDGQALDAGYWWRNLRDSVRFAESTAELLRQGYRHFLEIGPHPVLATSIRECAGADAESIEVLTSLRRREPERAALLAALGMLHVRCWKIDWRAVAGSPGRHLKLPHYPWQRETHWCETEESRGLRQHPSSAKLPGFRGPQVHPLLGREIDSPAPGRAWGATFDLTQNESWLIQHKVQGSIICPAAASIEMAMAAARQYFEPNAGELLDVEIPKALYLSIDQPKSLQLRIDNFGEDFEISNRDVDGQWIAHVHGRLSKGTAAVRCKADLNEIRSRCPRIIDAAAWNALFVQMGLGFGRWFQSVEAVACGEGEALATIRVPDDLLPTLQDYLIHPAILDNCIQVLRGALPEDAPPQLFMPRRISRVRLHAPLTVRGDGAEPQMVFSHVRLVNFSQTALTIDIRIYDADGLLLAELDGLTYQAIKGAGTTEAGNADDFLYEYRWISQQRSDAGGIARPDGGMPNPEHLAETVRPRVAKLAEASHRRRQYGELEIGQESLCAAYTVAALRELGFDFSPRRTFTAESLAAELGVHTQYGVWFAKLIALLESQGVVRSAAGDFEVRHTPEPTDLPSGWKSLVDRFPAFFPDLWLLHRCGMNLAQLLRGETDPLPLLFAKGPLNVAEHLAQDGGRTRIYHRMAREVLLAILDEIPQQRPLRILEIGGASGGLTAHLLADLPPARTEYVFSDASDSSFAVMAQKFGDFPFFRCQLLNVETDPLAQGFDAEGFDLVVAGDALHAGADSQPALDNVQRLLRPGGLLIALAANRTSAWQTMVGEILDTSRQLGSSPARQAASFAPWPEWCDRLTAAGFESTEAIADIDDLRQAWEVLILARAPDCKPPMTAGEPKAAECGHWLILADQGGTAQSLADCLHRKGQEAIFVFSGKSYEHSDPRQRQVRPEEPDDFRRLLDEAGGAGCLGIVHLWSLDATPVAQLTGDSLEQSQQQGCVSALHLLQACAARPAETPLGVWFVTRGTQPVGPAEPLQVAQSPLWGLNRVAVNELPRCRSKMIDLGTSLSTEEMESLADELQSGDAEDEVALRENRRYVHRLVPATLVDLHSPAGGCLRESPGLGMAFRLEAATPGMLDPLKIVPFARRPVAQGEIEIAVEAAGLNFKDVMLAMGVLSQEEPGGQGHGPTLGMECAGRITAIGEGVGGFAIGDEVVAYAQRTLGSHTVADARLVAAKPPALTMEEAATIPAVFLTAHYSLYTLAKLKAGQRILIHAGAGGVGLAAIQLAQLAGAEVFATAGSDDKREFLRAIGVPHALNSRTLDFSAQIMEITHGEGVDVVLNSLAGEAIPKSLAVLRPYGCFIEMGKRDIVSNTKIGLRPFARCLSYFAVDLFNMCLYRQDLAQATFQEVMRLVAAGTLHPLPHRTFPIGRAAEAFQYMAKSRHLGKIILSVREADRRCIPADRQAVEFRADGTYLITGGLGQFGLATAKWLVENGAKHLVLVGRSPARPKAQQQIAALQHAGAIVRVMHADVAREDQSASVVEEIRHTMPPLRGIFHAAMVLDDGALPNQNRERLLRVLAPKVLGAWNLHALTLQDPLEHFVLFSSIAAVVGNPGQSGYVAANVFLDTLACHRRALGLPAISVNWPVVADTEAAEAVAGQLAAAGLRAVSSKSLLAALQRLLSAGAVNPTIGKVDWTRWFRRAAASVAPRFRTLRKQGERAAEETASESGQEALLPELVAKESSAGALRLIVACLRQHVGRVLGMAPDKVESDRPLVDLGLDSLMSFDLSQRIKNDLGVEVPSMKLLSKVSLDGLAADLLERLKPTAPQKDGQPAEQAATPATAEGGPAIAKPAGQKVGPIDWIQEAALDADVVPTAGKPATGQEQTILLTGATGFLGSFLLRDLLADPGKRVICLVRCADEAEGRNRIRAGLEHYLLWQDEFAPRIEVVRGDLARPQLGLASDTRQRLEEQVDLVLHNGAWLDLVLPYAIMKASNVSATHELLKLACRGRAKSFHYVSSLAVLDSLRHRGRVMVCEDDVPADFDRMDYGYAQSKAVAETMVRAAAQRGLSTVIYRPGLICSDSTTGAGTRGDILSLFLKSWLEVAAAPDTDRAMLLTPVDFVSRGILTLAAQPESFGQTFHLVGSQSVPIKDFATMVADAGYPLRRLPYGDWRSHVMEFVNRSPTHWLTGIVPFLGEQVSSEESMKLWPPAGIGYDCARTLQRLPVQCPAITPDQVNRAMAFLAHTGYINGQVTMAFYNGNGTQRRQPALAGDGVG